MRMKWALVPGASGLRHGSCVTTDRATNGRKDAKGGPTEITCDAMQGVSNRIGG